MATTIVTKQHDTKITFTDIPTIDGVPMTVGDLAGCTLKFIMKSDTVTISQTATIVGATFSYDPVPADVAAVGKYRQEWELTYPTTKKLTFPNNGYNVVKIIEDLG